MPEYYARFFEYVYQFLRIRRYLRFTVIYYPTHESDEWTFVSTTKQQFSTCRLDVESNYASHFSISFPDSLNRDD
jgi:hypothetical protein